MTSDRPTQSTARTLLVYSVLRLGMFLGVFALMMGIFNGRDGILLSMVVAAIVSGVGGYFLLSRQRAPLAEALDRRVNARRERAQRRTASEDEAADSLRALQAQEQQQRD